MANPIPTLLKRYRASYLLLAQATVWIAGSIATFLLPPPIGASDEIRVWVRFAQFLITIVIGMAVLGALRWKEQRHVVPWAAVSLICLVLASAAFLSYQFFSTRWTALYNQKPVVIGDVYTEWGAAYRRQKPELTPEKLIEDAAGKVEKIWTRNSLAQRRFILALLYVAATPIFTMCIIGIVQAMQCAVAKATAAHKGKPRARRKAVGASVEDATPQ